MALNSPLSISVIICTHSERRWQQLCAALAALQRQTVSPHEIIVVVDRNPVLLQRLRAAVPEVKTLPNRHAAGASGARNTAVAVAQGEILAFLDDDAMPCADWLERLTTPYANPRVIGVGGPSLPHWESRRPWWFPPEFDWVVGCSYVGMPVHRQPVRNLWGVNMSLRRFVLARSGLFNTAFGPVGATPINCEETELCVRIRQAWPHCLLLYEPEAMVSHWVPRERARWRYFLKRSFYEGRSKARLVTLAGTAEDLHTERAYLTEIALDGAMRYIGQALSGQNTRAGVGRVLALAAGLAAATIGYIGGRYWPDGPVPTAIEGPWIDLASGEN